MSIDELLKIIQRTNPAMTRELLIYELSQCQYSSKALIHTEECCQKNKLNFFERPQVWRSIFTISILTFSKIQFRFRSNPVLKIEKIFS